MSLVILGAVAMGCLTAAVVLLRFWRDTGDRLFLLFALSFALEGCNRALLALTEDPSEGAPVFYVVRLVSFLLIIAAIADKNLAGPSRRR